MTKLKEVNTYTLEELKWYKLWCDSNIATKPSLDSKFKEALDENSKTEIEFDLDDLKLIKSGADNYYDYHVKDDYKLSIEEDDILDKLDARISFLRKKNIHQYTKDVFNSPVKSSAEETVSNAYVDKQEEIWVKNHIYVYSISDIYWIDKWCENILKVTDSLKHKCRDASKEIFKITGKLPEATSDKLIVSVYVFFSLKELKEIRNYASMYYSSNVKTVEARNTLCDINLRIKYLENQLPTRQAIGYPSQNTMNLNSYQKEAFKTAKKNAQNLNYMVLGLTSEAGEVAGKLKKHIRDNVFDKKAFLAEVGDVLWYIAGICSVCDVDLEDVAKENINKLIDRQNRNMISGSGDNR